MSKKNRDKRKKKAKKQGISPKLRIWQERLSQSDVGYGDEVAKMDHREALYNGDRNLKPMVSGDLKGAKEKTPHVRNIVFENIESQISSTIPQPKVTPLRQEDEHKAMIIENWIRGELDRWNSETMNDMAERTVPIQGGVLFLHEWDNSIRSHTTVGEQTTCLIHPKQLAPQPGIYTGIEDMDWVIIKRPTTKGAIRRKYGVDLQQEGESEPQLRAAGDEDHSEDCVTQYIGFARNDDSGIDRYSWVNNTELEDLENYQARRLPTCTCCGRVRPMRGQIISGSIRLDSREDPDGISPEEMAAGQRIAQQIAGQMMAPKEQAGFLAGVDTLPGSVPETRYDGGPCPWCGEDDWEDKIQEYEEVYLPIETRQGRKIPGEHFGTDEMGNAGMVPTKVPFYRPDIYPIVLQKSVSVFGQLLGNSDVDAIEDQQNTINRMEKKIIDRLLEAGSVITLPPKGLRIDPRDNKKWHLSSPADKAMIGLYEFKGNLQYEMAYLAQVYEEARQILGITDSFQGRSDATATSGKAKEFSAAQAAGRMESKRVMKNAAYAKRFELMFKFALAYADEPRMVSYKDSHGDTVYAEFNRYDFLEQDRNGEWYWNDRFLFSCDSTAPLANNREAMWQETRNNLQSGAFGNPQETETLVLFWTKMELLHYPGAGQTKKYLEEKLKREQEQAQQMQQMQFQMQMAQIQAQAAAQRGMPPQASPAPM